jgi:hypothetical protein
VALMVDSLMVSSGHELMVTGCGFSEAHQFWWSEGAAA